MYFTYVGIYKCFDEICLGQGCFLCVIILQLLKFANPIYTKCTLIPPLHFDLNFFKNSQMLLQIHLVKLLKIG